MTIDAAIALNRFGIGAIAGEGLPLHPKRYLLEQLQSYDPAPSTIASLRSRTMLAQDFADYRADARALRLARSEEGENADRQAAENARKASRQDLRDNFADGATARLATAATSQTGFAERLVHFWSNHFAVSADSLPVTLLAGDYEFFAIRPHIMGKFSDLLNAAVEHPAMLMFLDQAQSVGPGSALAQRVSSRRGKDFGLNENLAREIMELHTMGVRTGYDQSDVTEFARALTGRTVPGFANGPAGRSARDAQPGETLFVNAIHEPGTRHIMGRSYPQTGAAQGRAVLADLAVHPATAQHIATKLAQHFVADVPPPALVARLSAIFLQTGGDLTALYRTLIESPEAWPARWEPEMAKFKSPWEWVVSALRGVGMEALPGNGKVANVFRQLGQPLWKPESPAGYADTAETWAGSAALMRRVELAVRLAQRGGGRWDARALAPQILPGTLSQMSAEALARAESPEQALALVLVAPEFMRR